jgi:HEPN domain-containing protein
MSLPNSYVKKKVGQWLEFADEDLRLARHGLTLRTGVPYRLIAYHAQQCAEKHIKAYLVFQGIDFPFTHNIARLLELCSEKAAWVKELSEAEELTPFAITTRYPGEDEAVSKGEALRAVAIADNVRRIIRRSLIGEGLKISQKSKLKKRA